MDIILANVGPVFAVIGLGVVLRRAGLTDRSFYTTADRLIYYIFLPALLFWKTATPPPDLETDWAWAGAVCGTIIAVHLLCLLWKRLSGMEDRLVGSFVQGAYRFNTYIGMAVVFNVFGDEGVSQFGLLVGLAIPLINILAISSLIWYSGRTYSGWDKIKLVLKSIVTNPLVIACAAGIGYARLGVGFPAYVSNTLRLLSLVALPLALLSVGSSLTFRTLGSHLKTALTASVFKLVLGPVLGYLALRWVGSSGLGFLTAMIFFALPTSTASYILSGQLGSDTDLAAAEIVVTTVLSIFSLSVVMALVVG